MNNCVLLGRLVRDPELRYASESQTAICSFTLAVDKFVKDKGADFIPVKVFGKSAENCSKYLTKGSQCAVEGRIQTGSYKNKDGGTVYTTDVIANRVEFLGSKGNHEEDGSTAPVRDHQDNNPHQDLPPGFSALDDDDDVPF